MQNAIEYYVFIRLSKALTDSNHHGFKTKTDKDSSTIDYDFVFIHFLSESEILPKPSTIAIHSFSYF